MVGCSLKEVEKYDRELKRIRFLEADLVTLPICVSDSVVAQDMKIYRKENIIDGIDSQCSFFSQMFIPRLSGSACDELP